jgi:hypothetical protein
MRSPTTPTDLGLNIQNRWECWDSCGDDRFRLVRMTGKREARSVHYDIQCRRLSAAMCSADFTASSYRPTIMNAYGKLRAAKIGYVGNMRIARSAATVCLDDASRRGRQDLWRAKALPALLIEGHHDAEPAQLFKHGFGEATRCDRQADRMVRRCGTVGPKAKT